MAKAPVMPLFTDALIGDTTHLSAEQFGAYMLILIATWRNNGNPLPDDDARMARVCKIGVTKWRRKVRPILREMFDVNESGWHQQRLEKEWNRVSRWLEIQAAKGAAGGKQTSSRRGSRGVAGLGNHNKEDKNLTSDSVPVAARAFAPGPAIARATDAQSQESNSATATRGGGWKQTFEALRMELPWIEPGKA